MSENSSLGGYSMTLTGVTSAQTARNVVIRSGDQILMRSSPTWHHLTGFSERYTILLLMRLLRPSSPMREYTQHVTISPLNVLMNLRRLQVPQYTFSRSRSEQPLPLFGPASQSKLLGQQKTFSRRELVVVVSTTKWPYIGSMKLLLTTYSCFCKSMFE